MVDIDTLQPLFIILGSVMYVTELSDIIAYETDVGLIDIQNPIGCFSL